MNMTAEDRSCELHKFLHDLDQRVAAHAKTSFMFQRSTFPVLPPTLKTPYIEVQKTYHTINDCWRADVLNFRAPRMTYRHLALAILAVVFCPELPELSITLERPESALKRIVIRYPGTTPRAVYNYLTQPLSFEYVPEEVEEHPWQGRCIPDTGWPEFCLTHGRSGALLDWEARDQVEGFGNDDASVLLASLLLNFGRDENEQAIVNLESTIGYRGVSYLSAEVAFHLPESDRWPEPGQR